MIQSENVMSIESNTMHLMFQNIYGGGGRLSGEEYVNLSICIFKEESADFDDSLTESQLYDLPCGVIQTISPEVRALLGNHFQPFFF